MALQFQLNLKFVMMQRGIKPTPYFLYRSGINPRTAKHLLNGNPKSIKFEVLMELCSALNCTPKELIVAVPPKGLAPDAYQHSHLKDWFPPQPVFPFIEAQNFTPDQMQKLNEAVEQIMNEG